MPIMIEEMQAEVRPEREEAPAASAQPVMLVSYSNSAAPPR